MFFSRKTEIFLITLVVLTLMSMSGIHASDLGNDQAITADDTAGNNDENPPGTFDDLRKTSAIFLPVRSSMSLETIILQVPNAIRTVKTVE